MFDRHVTSTYTGYKYAGSQQHHQCLCGNRGYDRYGQLPESACNAVCYGDSSQMCGGGWVNSVYTSKMITGISIVWIYKKKITK